MRISRIVVEGLFDRFTHDLPFKPDERIAIMIGPNGFGKTMILRLINALLRQPVRSLVRYPFRQLEVMFEGGAQLVVDRDPEQLELVDLDVDESPDDNRDAALRITYKSAEGDSDTYIPPSRIRPKEIGFPIGLIEELIPNLDQVGPKTWRNRSTGEALSLEDVVELHGDRLPLNPSVSSEAPVWFKDIREAVPVRLIGAERLTTRVPSKSKEYGFRTHRHARARTVRQYSEDLASRVKNTLTDYGALAQRLDQSFPLRFVEEEPSAELTTEHIRERLGEIEARRARLSEAGLLGRGVGHLGVPRAEAVDEARRGVLAVYIRDAEEKLAVFDELFARVESFRRIANSRLLHKSIQVSEDGLRVVSSDGSELELEMLSSGEQHELVLLYELLFRVPNDAFIMIDEPELSLHVAWQEKFLPDLEEMADLSNFRALLATHSPQIIGDRWDLTIQLKGPNGE